MSMPSQRRLYWLVVRHEFLVLFADRTLPLSMAVLAALVLYGLYNGLAATADRDRVLGDIATQQARRQESNLDLLRQVMAGTMTPDPFANPADPASIGSGMGARYAVLPALPLAPVALGQADLIPTYYRVTYGSRVNFMFDGEIENPWNLLSGRFDLAFVITYLLPLLILASSYNLLSAEREHGTLRLLLSQPVSLRTLVLGKVTTRLVALLGTLVIVPALALLVTRPELRGADLLSLATWALLVVAYGTFWLALAVAVNAYGRSSATNALALVGAWVLFVLVAPLLLNLAVGIARPAPSRTELATRTRLLTIDGLNRYKDLLGTDYRYGDEPDLLLPKDGKIAVPARRQGLFLLQQEVDRQLDAELDAFERQMAAQQSLVDRFGVVSPAVVVYEGMAALGGNGSARFLRFQEQVDDFHRRWTTFFEPRILDGIAIVEADFARMPAFLLNDVPRQALIAEGAGRILLLLLPTLVLFAVGLRRLRSYTPVGA